MNFDDYCIYMAGFDRLGRYLYGSWWTGNEHHAYPVAPPEDVTNERQQILDEIDRAITDINKVRATRRSSMLTYQQSADLDAKDKAASKRNKELNHQLNALPRNMEGHTVDFENYNRRCITEEYLQHALENDHVMGWFGIPPIGMRWSEWGNRDGFTLYPELSIIRTPNHGRNRRMAFFFQISKFEEWLMTLESFNPENQPELSIEEIYQKHMRDYVSVHGNDWTKPKLKEYVREQEGHVQTNAFDRAYRSEPAIPSEKKKGGRPRKL